MRVTPSTGDQRGCLSVPAQQGLPWAHLGTTGTSRKSGHLVRPQRLPKVAKGEPPAFPDERFEELLFEGFCPAGRPDYRGMLITLLLHGAGFRESEPCHLDIEDVFANPGRSTASRSVHSSPESRRPLPRGGTSEAESAKAPERNTSPKSMAFCPARK